ncbi:hypothetical protein E2C01_012210 [Portunus trituberculatus]|uniref:Uncharacterized protein n=1 Tax=Portunus trituberculatus TaxID=210409 RepID=A0A5B7DDC1_PORTR|nr:hypothetical protein [Portunus trituberculatus]
MKLQKSMRTKWLNITLVSKGSSIRTFMRFIFRSHIVQLVEINQVKSVNSSNKRSSPPHNGGGLAVQETQSTQSRRGRTMARNNEPQVTRVFRKGNDAVSYP